MSDEQDHEWEALRAIKCARELMQGSNEWAAGFEVGRAQELLKRDLDEADDE